MDLTKGKPIVQIMLFALPLVLGTLFQQLYSFIDTVIVGRFVGVDALAAVGTTYSLNFLVMGFIQGLCAGIGIVLAQSVGAQDKKELNCFFINGSYLCIAISLLLTALTTILAESFFVVIDTPDKILDMAVEYARIICLGIPATMLYNFSASALRADGDSKYPFYSLLCASVLNILLDYIFIVPLQGGVKGAAWATVLSQLLSGILNTWRIWKHTDIIRKEEKLPKPSRSHIKKLCVVGVPMGIEYSVSAIGAVVLQGAINSLGSVTIAAQTAGEKIRQMFTLPMESVGMAMATYTGQNYGAKRIDRIKQGIWSGVLIQYVYCAVIWVVILFLKQDMVKLVLGNKDSQAALEAVKYLEIMSMLFFIHGSLMIMRNVLQGLGYSMQAVISGAGELIGRSLGSWLAISSLGFTAICYANPLAWSFALFYCMIMVWQHIKKLNKQLEHNGKQP